MPSLEDPIAAPADAQPTYVGAHPALDLLNSVLAPHGTAMDFLHDGETLVRWLAGSTGLASEVTAAVMALPRAQRDRLAGRARQLRESFRAPALRWAAIGSQGVGPDDLAALNAWLAASPLTPVLVRGAQGLEMTLQRDAHAADALIAELAAACADLLVTLRPDQVRQCENPPCTMMFADTKRGPRRRWCSMAVCGNRNKAAAHRRRQQG